MDMHVHIPELYHFALCEDEEPVKKWLHEFDRENDWTIDRLNKGYSALDTWDISGWFLSTIPNMLEDFRKNLHSYPGRLQLQYGSEEGEERWGKILDEMIFLFREANEDTCQKKNPYQEETHRIYDEFRDKYGILGEKLQTEEELEAGRKGGYSTYHGPDEIPEYAETVHLHLEAEKELGEYRKECLTKAMALFTEWFWDLWD